MSQEGESDVKIVVEGVEEREDKENGSNGSEEVSGANKADQEAQTEFASKYGIKKKPSTMAQRKISQGGKQYFDSGDYNLANRKERKEIASHPVAMNPALAQLRAKATVTRTQPSKLAAASKPSPLAN